MHRYNVSFTNVRPNFKLCIKSYECIYEMHGPVQLFETKLNIFFLKFVPFVLFHFTQSVESFAVFFCFCSAGMNIEHERVNKNKAFAFRWLFATKFSLHVDQMLFCCLQIGYEAISCGKRHATDGKGKLIYRSKLINMVTEIVLMGGT